MSEKPVYREIPTLYIIENEIEVKPHWIACPQHDAWLVPEDEWKKLYDWVN